MLLTNRQTSTTKNVISFCQAGNNLLQTKLDLQPVPLYRKCLGTFTKTPYNLQQPTAY